MNRLEQRSYVCEVRAMLVAEVQRLNKLINKKEGKDSEVHQTLDGCHT